MISKNEAFFYTISRNRLYCFSCNHKWTNNSLCDSFNAKLKERIPWHNFEFKVKTCCPNCGRTLEYTRFFFVSTEYYSVIVSTFSEFQVIRYFNTVVHAYRTKETRYFTQETDRHYLSIDKAPVSMHRLFNHWSETYHGMLEFRNRNNYLGNSNSSMRRANVYRIVRVLDIVKRNGFSGSFHEVLPHRFIYAILSRPKAETLLKAGQIELFEELIQRTIFNNKAHDTTSEKVEIYWRSILICIRNNYIVEEVSDWYDYIMMLKEHSFDILNHHYVCPENLDNAHQKMVAYANKQTLSSTDFDQKTTEYQKQKQGLLDISIKDQGFSINPIRTVQEFYLQGEMLNHCIYANEYHLREGSLMLSTHVNDKLVETTEFDLIRNEVIQSRGKNNKATEYSPKIVSLINTLLPKLIYDRKI